MANRYASLSPESSSSDNDEDDAAPIPSLNSRLQPEILSLDRETTPTKSTAILMPSSGPVMSSPIVGNPEEKARKRREKSARKQKARADASQQELLVDSQEREQRDLHEVHEFLRSKGLRFGQYLKFISDPEAKQGNIWWQEFFKHRGEATQILDWWVSSQNSDTGRDEVVEWAVRFTASQVARDARNVTQSKLLQTLGKVVDQDLVNYFSYTKIHDQLLETAPVAMRVLKALATSPHAEDKHTERRQGQTKTVRSFLLLSSAL